MNKELVWLTLPLIAVLGQLGGTFNKLFRRLGVPLVITIATWLYLGWSWWWPVLFISIFGVTTLPFTFYGESVHDKPPHWKWVDLLPFSSKRKDIAMFVNENWNWIWIWVAGYLLGLPSVMINYRGVVLAFVSCCIQGIVGTASNLKSTRDFFPWKFCEGIVWFMVGYIYIMCIELKGVQ